MPKSNEQEGVFNISFKINNDEIVINTLVFTERITKLGLHIGDKIKTINGIAFKDYCELRKYQYHKETKELM